MVMGRVCPTAMERIRNRWGLGNLGGKVNAETTRPTWLMQRPHDEPVKDQGETLWKLKQLLASVLVAVNTP